MDKDVIKFLIMDVDGTLTDGKIYMGNTGELCKAFDAKDGLGISMLAIPNGIEPIILTGRMSNIVVNRCKELGIQRIYQGIRDKKSELCKQIDDLSVAAYIGDDLNDLECMQMIKTHGGIIGCPADAASAVIKIADFVSPHDGGSGAVRDFIEWIIDRGDRRR